MAIIRGFGSGCLGIKAEGRERIICAERRRAAEGLRFSCGGICR